MTRARALAALLFAATAAPALAQPYDPAYRWRTLSTSHFHIHFHQGEEDLASLVAATAERAHAVLVPLLGGAPEGPTEVVLSDDSDDANGSATPIPYDTIRLLAASPTELSELNAYRDYVSSLLFHEYVHILHLGHVEGIPALGNRIFGRLFTPNGLTPSWLTEGLAVLHEADGDPGPGTGRNRSSIHSMYLRSLAVEPPGFPRLDEASNPPLFWPVGTLPYLVGGRFLEFLQEQSGDEAIAGYIARQGAQVWPYAPSWVGRPWFGAEFPELWAGFVAREEAQAQEELSRVRKRPVTRPARITSLGGRAGWPRFTADGSAIAYLRQDLDEAPAMLRVTPGGSPAGPPLQVDAGAGLALGGGRAVVAAAEVWHEYRLYDDLWQLDLATLRRQRLTDGARASEPSLSQDGAFLAYVRRTGPGQTAILRRHLPDGAEELAYEGPGEQVFAPALSPDGRRLAFAVQAEGRRDVVVLDDRRRVPVTSDDAVDTSPAFTPDGRWLLFSSDRTGVYNLYAWPVEECLAGAPSCALRQVTNVETGAFQPAVSPDGRTIAFVTYSRAGYDLATIPFDPESWLDPEPPSEPRPQLAPAPVPELVSRPYRPLETLLPTWWLPLLLGDPEGAALGAMTSGSDVLGRHAFAATAWYGLRSREPGYALAYLGGWSWPQLDLSSSRYLATARAGERRLQAVFTPLAAGLDFRFTRVASAALLRLGWSGTLRDVLGAAGTARRPEDVGRADTFGSEVSLRGSWTDARRFVRSISPEEGRTLSLAAAVASRQLGGDYDLAQVRGSAAQYLRIPFTRHGVLALRVAGGAADGALGTDAPFTLGGVSQPDVLGLLLGTAVADADELRGYPSGWLEGTGFALGNLELRFPLLAPELGHTTWPIFLRRVHGAVFADLGDAFDLPGTPAFAGHRFRWDQLHLGAGGELRLELALGYFAVTDLRLGLAHAFGRPFRGEGRESGAGDLNAYLRLGSAF